MGRRSGGRLTNDGLIICTMRDAPMKMLSFLHMLMCDRLIRLVAGLVLVMGPTFGVVHAQNSSVQVIEGTLETNQAIKYLVPDLSAGDILYAYVDTLSGNFDPFMGIANGDVTLDSMSSETIAAVQAATSGDTDPIAAIEDALARVFLTTDDDGGIGYDAALSFIVPEDGDYALVLRSSYAKATFGTYRLLVGVNAPDVLNGEADSTGDILAVTAETTDPIGVAVQEVTKFLTPETSIDVFRLEHLSAGDTLYVYMETIENEPQLRVMLQDFVGKHIRSAHTGGAAGSVSFEYTLPEDASDYQLIVSAGSAPEELSSSYRLLIGVNAPSVLAGAAEPSGRPVIALPTEVLIWLEIDQITSVNQPDENYSIVGALYLRWNDPQRAFRPDECHCAYQSYFDDDFNEFTRVGATWPEYVMFNQQWRRETQLRGAVVASDGTVTLTERFTVILQAPDFDFRMFPFDSQTFYFRIDMLFNDDRYVLVPVADRVAFGSQLGEEEFVFHSIEPSVRSENSISRFALRFEAKRNFTYYAFRVLLPIGLILLVTWVTFFLGDFVKRVDVAGANLLVFVAFNFTVSDDLPRLGYLTLLDTLLISTFVVTSLIIVLNVYLQWLTKHHQGDQVHRIDRIAIWAFPLGFAVLNVLLILFFVSTSA